MSREAMQQALEALELLCPMQPHTQAMRDAAMNALRAALAKPQTTHWEGCEAVHPECRKPEPVAWISEGGDVSRSRRYMDEMGFKCEPLYTAPTPRKPLTYDELEPLCEAFDSYDTTQNELVEFARAIERAHGITGDSNE